MQYTAANIQCVNPHCKAANPQSSSVCNECNTPVVKRYLWMVVEGSGASYNQGQLIGDRYLVKQPQIVLDTQPATAPQTPETIPPYVAAYLQLFVWRLHVPQIYDLIQDSGTQIYLLEHNIIPTDAAGEPLDPLLFPSLGESFPKANAIRQLNWLWQLARLWQPLQDKRVASSLIEPNNLRTNGGILKLQQLKFDETESSLLDLAKILQLQIAQAKPAVEKLLTDIVEQLNLGKIRSSEQLVYLIETAVQQQSKSQSVAYQIYSLTDSGPSREHNEDACYPPAGKLVELKDTAALAIVCDGIGGHEGGEVAAGMAIESLQQSVVATIKPNQAVAPADIEDQLFRKTQQANDLISDRNDSEHRHERERMGTTLVMTLAANPWLYLTHVGDSRIYLITTSGCQPVTVDDDLASREVRLGYALYRDATQYPSTGALVQALGMSSSNSLHPNVERLIIDEECLLLLCSDGLSDYERVEQYWESQILPLLQNGKSIQQVAEDLIAIANTYNGHDNSTVALLHCQPQLTSQINSGISEVSAIAAAPSPPLLAPAAIPPTEPSKPPIPTTAPSKSGLNWLMVAGAGLVGASLLVAAAIFAVPWLRGVEQPEDIPLPESEAFESDSELPRSRSNRDENIPSASSASTGEEFFEPDDVVEIQEAILLSPESDQWQQRLVPVNSMVKVIGANSEVLTVIVCDDVSIEKLTSPDSLLTPVYTVDRNRIQNIAIKLSKAQSSCGG